MGRVVKGLKVADVFIARSRSRTVRITSRVVVAGTKQVRRGKAPVKICEGPRATFATSFFKRPSILGGTSSFRAFTRTGKTSGVVIHPRFMGVSGLSRIRGFGASMSQKIIRRISFEKSGLRLRIEIGGSMMATEEDLRGTSVQRNRAIGMFLCEVFTLENSDMRLVRGRTMESSFMVV